jgi:hypothetical protein
MRLIRRSDQVLRQYVLGKVQDPPRLDIEERLVTDPEFFESLGATEEELAEEYLEGTLPPADREHFERHYLTSHDRRRSLGFVRLLKAYAAARRTAGAIVDRPRLVDLIRLHPAWASAAAAVVVLLIGGNLWLVRGNYRLQEQFDRVSTKPASEEQRRQQLERQMEGLTSQANTLQNRFDSQVPGGGPRTFGLTPGRLRAAVPQVQRVTVAPGAQHVRLELRLPGNDSSPYLATLVDDEKGETLWSQARLNAEIVSTQAMVVVLVPAAVLSSGGYQLKLTGAAARGRLEVIPYYFSVE